MKPKIALSVNQMKGLAALGLDISDASMLWIDTKIGYHERQLLVSNDLLSSCDKLGPVPAYTLEDILLKMSFFTLDCPENTYGNINVYDCFIGADFVCSGDTPIDAAYHALVWLASHHQECIVTLNKVKHPKTVES